MSAPDNWLWLAVVAIGGFSASQLWPWVRGLVDAEFKARREGEREAQATARRMALEMQGRFVTATESLAISNRQIADTLIALQFHVAATERSIHELRTDLARAGLIERRTTRKMRPKVSKEDVP